VSVVTQQSCLRDEAEARERERERVREWSDLYREYSIRESFSSSTRGQRKRKLVKSGNIRATSANSCRAVVGTGTQMTLCLRMASEAQRRSYRRVTRGVSTPLLIHISPVRRGAADVTHRPETGGRVALGFRFAGTPPRLLRSSGGPADLLLRPRDVLVAAVNLADLFVG